MVDKIGCDQNQIRKQRQEIRQAQESDFECDE